jgi:aspartyl-tRNA(Asn)/glutamyl-tRNA(Gln) amidotransferase subunit B
METDTAKAIHTQWSSLIDYNRAATPLIEIVTEPEFHSAAQVSTFLKELQRIARYNDISDADMEKWQMRVDVNISISKDDHLGIRNEIKNMNSISAIMRAIEHEYERQVTVLESWGAIEQATRRRDDVAGTSFVMRSKEDALDYRYFPEPDLPPLHLDRETLDELESLPLTIPSVFIKRCREEFWFHKEYINALINDKETLDYFLACLNDGCDARETVKWIAGPMLAYTKENFLTLSELKFERWVFVRFLHLIGEGKLIGNQYKMIMEKMIATGESPDILVTELWFDAVANNDDDSVATIQTILANNPSIVEQYHWGKETTISFFVGQVMKALAGKIDPNKAKQLLEVELCKDAS